MALIALIQRAQPAQPRRGDRARAARRVRGLAVLRRRHHHARDLGAVGGRGPRGRVARPRGCSSSRSGWSCSPCCSPPSASAPARSAASSARSWSSGSACWRCPACVPRWSSTRRSSGALAALRRGVPLRPRSQAFVALGGVVLAVTGAEALYADMGHFGRARSGAAWFGLVFPALILNYLGQGALILDDPAPSASPFFLLFPDWARIPMVMLGHRRGDHRLPGRDLRRVSASRARRSGSASCRAWRCATRRSEEVGQVYVPAVNWIMFAAVVALVVGFGSSEKLATRLRDRGHRHAGDRHAAVLRSSCAALWRRPLWLVVVGAVAFLIVDLMFFAANLTKIVHGGWFPLAIARRGLQRAHHLAARARDRHHAPGRRGGAAARVRRAGRRGPPSPACRARRCSCTPTKTAPLALRANVEHNHVLHECVLIVSVTTERVPHVPRDERLAHRRARQADDGITHIIGRFGFQDEQDVPQLLRQAASGRRASWRSTNPSYFVSRIDDRRRPTSRAWRLAQTDVHRASRTTRPTPSRTSISPTSAPWSWVRGSSCRFRVRVKARVRLTLIALTLCALAAVAGVVLAESRVNAQPEFELVNGWAGRCGPGRPSRLHAHRPGRQDGDRPLAARQAGDVRVRLLDLPRHLPGAGADDPQRARRARRPGRACDRDLGRPGQRQPEARLVVPAQAADDRADAVPARYARAAEPVWKGFAVQPQEDKPRALRAHRAGRCARPPADRLPVRPADLTGAWRTTSAGCSGERPVPRAPVLRRVAALPACGAGRVREGRHRGRRRRRTSSPLPARGRRCSASS